MSGPLLLGLPWKGRSLGGFTSTRVGGVSGGAYGSLNLGLNTADDPASVVENRRLAFEREGLEPSRVVHLRQVHGQRIVEAKEGDAGRGSLSWEDALADSDAVFTRVRGLALSIGHADCLAVALADADAGLLGLAHAGWRGALAGLPGLLAQRMVAEGASYRRLQAVLSPCLGPSSLELGEEQHALFQKVFARSGDFCSPLEKGHFFLDLWTCARSQLLDAGLDSARIQGQELDTAGHADLFYSHRRDAGKTGRMLTVAVLL